MPDRRKETIGAKLAATRQNLLLLLNGLNAAQWETLVFSEGEGWRVSDLLRHLVDAERGMTGLIENIRQGGEGVPADFDLQRWNARAVSKAREKSPEVLLAELDTNRARLLQLLNSLAEADWNKRGRHGSLHILSVEEILHLIADHESRHTADIQRALVP